jgi:ABC-type sugar transport system substrate-binding protein
MSQSVRAGARRRSVAYAILLCLVLFTAACGSDSDSGSSQGQANETSAGSASAGVAKARQLADAVTKPPTKVAQTVPLPKAPPTGKTVVFVDNGYPDTKKIGQGIRAAAEAVGWKFVDLFFDAASPSAFRAAMMNALTKSPDVVLEAGYPQTVFGQSVIDAYKKANVPLIPNSTHPVTDNGTVIGTSDGVSNGYRNNYRMGQALGYWFVADSSGKGHAVLENLPTYPTLKGVADGFKQVTDSLCPDCKVNVVTVGLSDVASGSLQNKVLAAVRRDAKTGYALFDNGQFGVGFESKLRAIGRSSVKVGGIALQPQEIADLRNGSGGGWIAFSEYTVGQAAMDQAVRKVMGLPLTENNGTQPMQLITKANVPSADEWNLPADGIDQYATLWKVASR